jgi:hypothetical protein
MEANTIIRLEISLSNIVGLQGDEVQFHYVPEWQRHAMQVAAGYLLGVNKGGTGAITKELYETRIAEFLNIQ